jgi:hypothetical protein
MASSSNVGQEEAPPELRFGSKFIEQPKKLQQRKI